MLCVLLQIMEFLELRQLIIVLALIMSLCSLWDTLRILLSRGLAHNGTTIAVIPLALTRDFLKLNANQNFQKHRGGGQTSANAYKIQVHHLVS